VHHNQSKSWFITTEFEEVISNFAAYLGETHQSIEGAILSN